MNLFNDVERVEPESNFGVFDVSADVVFSLKEV